MNNVVTFGEIMLRLAPEKFEMIEQANKFSVNYGGGEANVAASLSIFGNNSFFVSVIPDNMVGKAAVKFLKALNINTDHIKRHGDRIGIYFLEQGASIRPSRVIYDRKDSSISQAESGDFDWGEIFKEKDWFHITGITPALSKNCAELSIEAIKKARALGLTTSCDLNYRKKLWTKVEARSFMSNFVQYTDVIIANEEDAADMLHIHAKDSDINAGKLSVEGYEEVARKIMKVSKAKLVAITLRESISASDNHWSAVLFDGENFYSSRKYSIHLVDRVGGGDSFAAGLIHGQLKKWAPQQCLDFAVAASALKQTIRGDINLATETEVLEIAGGNISGRIQR